MVDWKVLLIILAIVIIVFGTRRLRTIGSDIGAGIRGIKAGINSEEHVSAPPDTTKESIDRAVEAAAGNTPDKSNR